MLHSFSAKGEPTSFVPSKTFRQREGNYPGKAGKVHVRQKKDSEKREGGGIGLSHSAPPSRTSELKTVSFRGRERGREGNSSGEVADRKKGREKREKKGRQHANREGKSFLCALNIHSEEAET